MIGERQWKKPFLCRMGLHSYVSAARPQRYWVEVVCERCGRRKVMPLSTGHERGGGGSV